MLEAKRDFLSSSKFLKRYIKISFALIITYNFVEHFEKKNKQTNLIDFFLIDQFATVRILLELNAVERYFWFLSNDTQWYKTPSIHC